MAIANFMEDENFKPTLLATSFEECSKDKEQTNKGLGLSVFFVMVIFAVVWNVQFLFWVSYQCFLALTYMHITWSFLISPGNPVWIKKLLRQGSGVPA